MKILYYSTSFYANHGGSIQSIELFKQLKKMEAVSETALYPSRVKQPGIKRKSSSSFRKILRKFPGLQVLFFYRRNRFYLQGLEEKIQEFQPDVLLMQIDSNFLQIKNIKRLFPDLLICTQINGSPFDEPFKNIAFKKWFLKQQSNAYCLSDLNIFVSDFSRKRIMGNSFDPARDVVIYNGTDTEKFYPMGDKANLRSRWAYPSKDFILGYIGTLDFHKQLGLLIEVFENLQKDFLQLRLVIIGDGPAYSRIAEKIKKMDLNDRIDLRGWVEHEKINEHLNCFDVAVHHYASTYMNPLKIFEYISAGLPVLAPDIPSVRNSFLDGRDLLITGPSKQELKSALTKLISDKELRENLSNNQHLVKATENDYTWQRYAKNVIDNIFLIKQDQKTLSVASIEK